MLGFEVYFFIFWFYSSCSVPFSLLTFLFSLLFWPGFIHSLKNTSFWPFTDWNNVLFLISSKYLTITICTYHDPPCSQLHNMDSHIICSIFLPFLPNCLLDWNVMMWGQQLLMQSASELRDWKCEFFLCVQRFSTLKHFVITINRIHSSISFYKGSSLQHIPKNSHYFKAQNFKNKIVSYLNLKFLYPVCHPFASWSCLFSSSWGTDTTIIGISWIFELLGHGELGR